MLANCQIFPLIARWLATIIYGHCLDLSDCGRYIAGATYIIIMIYVIHCTVIMVYLSTYVQRLAMAIWMPP